MRQRDGLEDGFYGLDDLGTSFLSQCRYIILALACLVIDHAQYLMIPKNRVGVLIGPKGSVKKEIEERGRVQLRVDSQTGEVTIIPRDPANDDPLLLLRAQSVVKAIGRGYTPEKAMFLFNDGYYLEVINLKEFTRNNKAKLVRLRSRLIGTRGRTRKTIEKMTKTSIVVQGSTVSIIGRYANMLLAKEAIMMIISGVDQNKVYGILEKRKKELEGNDELWKEEDKEAEELGELFEDEDPDLDREFDRLIEDSD